MGKSIDLYQIHSVTNDSPVLDDPTVLKELEEMKKKGIEIGISTSGPDQEITIEKFLKINEKTKLFTFLQTTINIFDQSCTAILKNASENKINIIAKEIFSNGRLTNANKKFHQNELIELVTIAKSVNLNLEELSYLWVYQLPFIKICLTGASTITQLDTNLKCIKKKDVEIPSLESFALSTEDYWSTRKLLNWN